MLERLEQVEKQMGKKKEIVETDSDSDEELELIKIKVSKKKEKSVKPEKTKLYADVAYLKKTIKELHGLKLNKLTANKPQTVVMSRGKEPDKITEAMTAQILYKF